MKTNHIGFNRWLALLVLASFTISTAAVVLRIGLGATPDDTTNSAGKAMGFNDPLDAEHYAIMVRNFNPADLLNIEHVYEWILLAVHVIGAWLLLSATRVPPRLTRWFFAAQAILFPLAFVALPFWPFLVADLVRVRMDREEFVDIPFIWAVSHPLWVVASLFIALAYRGAGLGLAGLWRAFTHAARAGTRTFVNAVR